MSRLIKSCFLVLMLTVLGGGWAGAQDAAELRALRADLEGRFAVLPLSEGLLLQPVPGSSGPRAVEITDRGIALDGEAVGTDELRSRLGGAGAAIVLAVAALDDAGRRALMAVEPAPEPPVAESAAAPVDGGEPEPMGEEEESAAVSAEQASEDARRARREKKHKYRRSGDSEVAFGSSVIVDVDEVTDDVLVLGGFLKVEGKVDGDATVIGGSATIEGIVTGDVTAIGGPVRLEEGSHVHGDVSSVGNRVFQDEGARVDGDVEQVPFNADFSFGPWDDWGDWSRYGSSYSGRFSPWDAWTQLGWVLVKLIFLIGLAWLLLLLAPGPIDRMERRIDGEPWKTLLVGFLAQVLFFPLILMVAVFLAVSIIGIPLLLILPFALLAIFIAGLLGCVAVAGWVGKWAEERFGWSLGSPYWVVLVGLAMVSGLSIIGDLLDFGVAPMRFVAGMLIFFGGLVSWVAWTTGFGAAVLTRFGTAESWSQVDELAAPLPPVPSASSGDPEAHEVDALYDEPSGDLDEPGVDPEGSEEDK